MMSPQWRGSKSGGVVEANIDQYSATNVNNVHKKVPTTAMIMTHKRPGISISTSTSAMIGRNKPHAAASRLIEVRRVVLPRAEGEVQCDGRAA